MSLRLNDAPTTGTGSTGALSYGTSPKARVSYVASWFDGIDRSIGSANYGAIASFTRPTMPPVSSATILVTSAAYDDAGRAYQLTDPNGVTNQTNFDDANRTSATIEALGTASERTTQFTQTLDNLPASMTAVNSTTGDQTTWWIYGTTLADSGVCRNDLLRCVAYPGATLSWSTLDSNGWANLTVDQWASLPVMPDNAHITQNTYNRLGEQTTFTDQRGTVRTFTRDLLGRPTDDGVTTVGSDTDSTVLRISRTYEIRGMVETITSADTATPGVGTILNQVKQNYNDFGQLIEDDQEHSGVVSGTTPSVHYAYDAGASSSNEIRLNQLTYPNGRTIGYSFGAAGGMSDYLNRVEAINDTSSGTTTLAGYTYLGTGTVIRITYPEPGIWLDLWGGTSGTFAGIDLFNRIVDQNWQNNITTTPVDIDRYQYGYDQNSNRLYKANVVGTAAVMAGLDEFYIYDPLNRLDEMQRGVLNGTQTGIAGTPSVEQDWTLDATGNWSNFVTKASGTTNLNQTRAANTVNEITDITESTGPTWVVPAYDAAGNTITMPQPADPTSSFTALYDAWNMMAGLYNGTTPVAKYAYDGRRFRIVKKTYTSGTLSETRDFYFTANWQDIEERVSGSMADQYVWGIRYIDELICRDDATPQGLYATQDANFNLTSICSTSGSVVERYLFDPYGSRFILGPAWSVISVSLYEWNIGFQGLLLDRGNGLDYARYRFYGATLGCWLQPDEDYRDCSNRYLALLANPLNFVDPYGRDSGIPGLTEPAPQLSTESCCGGMGYDPATQCCENNSVVAKVRIGVVVRLGWVDHVDTTLADGSIVGWFGSGAEDISSLKDVWNWRDSDVFDYQKYLKFRSDYVSVKAAHRTGQRSTWCTFPVCPSEAQALATAWKTLAAKGKHGPKFFFAFFGTSCVAMTCKNLRQAGVPTDPGSPATATEMLKNLKSSFGSALDCKTGYFGYVGGSATPSVH